MLDKAYNPESTEDSIYEMWQKAGAFTPPQTSSGEPYCIIMPPPNATGQLHLGHAVMLALEDIFCRYQRMQGKDVLWLPGTDHAAIATENLVIQKLKREGIKNPRAEFGRELLVQKIKDFVAQSQDTIRSQIAKMGSSCDWSREAYTMDPTREKVVQVVFKKMFEDGLIYRGYRSISWDPNLQTNVSDDEVDYKEQTDPFYVFTYGPFQIGTVRPETKFADKYIVVHPDDERYSAYEHMQQFTVEWINGPITATLIKDEVADMKMGTGAMTITPWHSQADFDLAQKYKLPIEQIIDFDGILLPIAGEFSGMHITKARPLIVEKLQQKNLVVSINENYVHSVACNSRGGGTIEPQVKEQWFIDVNKKVDCWKGRWTGQSLSIKEVMQDAVRRNGEFGDRIDIIPARFSKTYFHWIDNLRDWCISRQLWWGHRIPVWYKNGELSTDSSKANELGWEQDPDTLDTWFSSALWTWSTLLDKEVVEKHLDLQSMLDASLDYKRFHPTNLLETGYDILPIWVAKMILMTTYITGDVPFKTVYLHGLIRDKNGQKMSKSKPETMIDPLEIIPKYGADALRLSMIVGQSPGNDSRLYEEKIAGYRNFINKLWNASRYVLMKCDEAQYDPRTSINVPNASSLADKALLHALNELTRDVTVGISEYRLSEVGERLYSFVWEYFCDWYLELSKGETNPQVLLFALRRLLILLHPYCPFVTEKLWSECKPTTATMLIHESWPAVDDALNDKQSFTDLQMIIDTIGAIRSIRSEQGIEPGKKITVSLGVENHSLFSSQLHHIISLARLENLFIEPLGIIVENVASLFLRGVEVHVHLDGLIDKDAERTKLTAEATKLEGFIAGITAKLSNEKFVNSAPEAVVNIEREKLASNTEKLQKIRERLNQIV
jgi:valyl-tRNA synthetase